MLKLNYTLLGNPVTKKNSQRIVKIKRRDGSSYMKIMPSKAYERYEMECGQQIRFINNLKEPVEIPVNLKCVYYMKTHRKVDLVNLLEATADIFVKYGILADDNRNVVYSTDGSEVLYDKKNPRVEVEITELKESEVDRWKA